MTDGRPPAAAPRRWSGAPYVLAAATLLLLLSLLALEGCSAGSARPPAVTASPGTCVARPGDQLVVLADDRNSQNSDNVVPLVRSAVARRPLTDALNAVSRVLSQGELQGLNRAVTIDHSSERAAADDFVARLELGNGLAGGSGTIVVASAGFGESTVLAEVYADVLRKAGYVTSVRVFHSREELEPALQSGAVQVTAEYAATLTSFLAAETNEPGVHPSTDLATTMSVLRPLAEARGLTVLDPAGATDQNAFAVTKETAESLGVTSLSELAARCGRGITFGGPPECPMRPFCQPALEKTYGLTITRFQPLDADGPLTRNRLQSGQVLLAEVFSSDADVVSAGD